jgi:hypothetical protein
VFENCDSELLDILKQRLEYFVYVTFMNGTDETREDFCIDQGGCNSHQNTDIPVENITMNLCTFSFCVAPQPLLGHGLLIIEASRSHSDTPHSVGLLWM